MISTLGTIHYLSTSSSTGSAGHCFSKHMVRLVTHTNSIKEHFMLLRFKQGMQILWCQQLKLSRCVKLWNELDWAEEDLNDDLVAHQAIAVMYSNLEGSSLQWVQEYAIPLHPTKNSFVPNSKAKVNYAWWLILCWSVPTPKQKYKSLLLSIIVQSANKSAGTGKDAITNSTSVQAQMVHLNWFHTPKRCRVA